MGLGKMFPDDPHPHPRILRYSKDGALFIESCRECLCRYNMVCQLTEGVQLPTVSPHLKNLDDIPETCQLEYWPEDDL